ncbi:PRC-barrel domain-containing protein [Sagittula sp. NFXS13]|uniref:PRC-barrel domain-containing protein n=1 Tax=Sagittula sp. NFXS13 TaxID=2819095 RepID=UPI0032DFAFB8
MKTFYASALALSVAATGAFAESHSADDAMAKDTTKMESTQMETNGVETTDTAMNDDMESDAKLIRTRDITGGNIYTMNEANDEGSAWDMTYDKVGADWNEIGEIEDIVLDSNGQMIGVVAEVGGFLDIGDKHVMLEMNDVKLVPVDDKTYAIVTRLNEEQLEQRESVDEAPWN